MKNIKLHAIILALIIVSELIGTHTLKFGIGRIVLLPMLYALLLGILTTPKFLNLSGRKEMLDASSLVGVTLMLLMARYGTLVGPTLPKILAASPALILQEFGNLGTVLLGVPVAVYLGLKRETIGAAHSIAREPNVALIGEKFGLDSSEGRGVMGVYIAGTVSVLFLRPDGQRCCFRTADSPVCIGYGLRRRLCQHDDGCSGLFGCYVS